MRVEALKAERNAASEEVARRKRAKEPADELMATLKASGEQVKPLDQELRDIDAELDRRAMTLPNFPAPEVPDGDANANRVVRSWGEPRAIRFHPEAALGAGRGAGHAGPPGRREAHRLRVSPLPRRRGAAGARARRLHARPPYPGARLHRGRAALPGEPREPHRHRAAAQVRGRPVRHGRGRPVPDSYGGGPGDQHPSGRHSRGRASCRSATWRGRPASGAKRGRTARIPAGSSGCTSSTRSSWCASAAPRTRRPSMRG